MNIKNLLHVKKGDLVKVIAGNDRGKIGTIIGVDCKNCLVKVSGVKLQTHYNKKDKNSEVDLPNMERKEGWIHASNVKKEETR